MRLLRLPSFTVTRFSSGIWSKSSPVTVAGTAPDFHRLPYYPRSRADLVRSARLGGFWMEGKARAMTRLMPRFAWALHTPKLGTFRDLPIMFDRKAKALVQRNIMFVGGFQIDGQAILICAF